MKENLGSEIKEFALSAGADLIGFAPAFVDEEGAEKLAEFVAQGRAGEMEYLKDFVKRTRPDSILEGAKSVIVIAVNYFRDGEATADGYGRVARYAYGRDYHKTVKGILKKIVGFIESKVPGAKCVMCVDSAPLMEKDYAVAAGLGFIGKNTTLIIPNRGSFVLLGEIVTDLELVHDEPVLGSCGTCRRCIDACPTGALTGPCRMDARLCVSYLTVEYKGEIAAELTEKIGDRVFGCDVCQEVCPYNKVFSRPNTNTDFNGPIAGGSIELEEILKMKDEDEFTRRFAGSPLMRAKLAGMKRNAGIVKNNQGGGAGKQQG